MQDRLLKGTPWRGVLHFALPLMFANVLQQLYSTVDTVVVGNFDSQTALAAVGSTNYLVMMYTALATGFSIGAGVLVSRAFGSGDEDALKRYAGSAILFLLLVGALATGLAFGVNAWFLRNVIGVPESVFAPALRYISIYSCGILFVCAYNILAAIMRALGDSRSTLYFLIVTSLVNIVLDLAFVAGLRWGVIGVALATVISQFCSMAVSFVYMCRKYPIFRPDRCYWRWDRSRILPVVKIGLPSVLQTVIVSVGFMLLQKLINSYGEVMTAAFTVAARLEIYMLVPMGTINNAMSTFTGQNLGARRLDRIELGAKQSILMSELLALGIGVVFFAFAPQICALFGIEAEALRYAALHVRVVAFDVLLYGAYQPILGLLLGLGRSQLTMLASLLELAVRVASAYALAAILPGPSYWWAEPLAFFLVFAAAFTLFFSGRWKRLIPGEGAQRAE